MHKPGKVKKVWAQSWKRGGGKLEEEKNKIKSGKSRQKNNKKQREKKKKRKKVNKWWKSVGVSYPLTFQLTGVGTRDAFPSKSKNKLRKN